MEIKGLDYNTGRDKLLMPEYGREIQKMVVHAVSLPTKEERLRCAKTIVRLMLTKVPQIRDNADFEQTLWDHLYLMSNRELDIDWPCDISNAEKILSQPGKVEIPRSRVRLRHYGRLVEELLGKVKAMPAGKERDKMLKTAAVQMKRDLMTWGHGSAEDAKVADDIAHMTGGAVKYDLKRMPIGRVAAIRQDEPKKGKKKK